MPCSLPISRAWPAVLQAGGKTQHKTHASSVSWDAQPALEAQHRASLAVLAIMHISQAASIPARLDFTPTRHWVHASPATLTALSVRSHQRTAQHALQLTT